MTWKHAAVLVALAGLTGCSTEMSVGRNDEGASARTATYRDNGTSRDNATVRTDTYRADAYRTDTYRADANYRADTNMSDVGQAGSAVGPGSDNSVQNARDMLDSTRPYGTGGTYRVDTYRTDTTYHNDRLRSDATIRNDTTYGTTADRGISARGDVSVGQRDTRSSTYVPPPAPPTGVTARTDINTSANTNTTRTQINQTDTGGVRAQGQAQIGNTNTNTTRTDINATGTGQVGSAVGPGAGNTAQNARETTPLPGTDTNAQVQGQAKVGTTKTDVGPGSDNTADQAQIAADRGAALSGALTPADFVANAASAGMFEVESSKLALQKSQDQTVKDFAQRMIDDHTKANDRLKALATQKNIPVPTQMLPQHKTQLDALRNQSGAAFDRAYMDAQMQGHQEAVALFDRASKNLTDNDLKNFASETLPTLREHNDMVKGHMHGAGGMGGTSNK